MAEDEHPAGEQQHLDDAGAGRADIHVARRFAELVGEHDQHQRGRDQLRDRSRRGDDAGGMAHVVAVARHDRQRDQAHGDDRGGDRAGDGAENRADQDDGVGQAAAHAAEQLAEAFEQILRKPAALEDDAHEGEERNGEQQLVREHREELVGEVAEEIGADQAELDGDEAEEQADRGQRECRRIADHHEDDQPHEHQRGHVMDQKVDHCSGFS